jgi:hypothetical protein
VHENGQRHRDYVTVVAGLPRSGTSMMMRMLEAGGIPALVDDHRPSDHHNPAGYYEFQRVKRLPADTDWLDEAIGKAVKIVYLLLYKLPTGYDYRVILMQRRLEEVIASQDAMLEATNASGVSPGRSSAELMEAFRHHLRDLDTWLRRQPNFAVQTLDYNAIVHDPMPSLELVDAFLGGGLDRRTMASVLDPALYRQRSGA